MFSRARVGLATAGAVLMVATMAAACGGGENGPGGQTKDPKPTATPKVLEGMFDVGGHRLHLHCVGSGSPTVVYLHGLSHTEDSGEANGVSAGSLPEMVAPKRRFCAYDRANVGRSDEVDGPLSAKSSSRDLDKLLVAADVEPPYVLLGASFGGLVAEVYASENPSNVAAMLLLDAGFPDELDLEKFFAKGDRLGHGKNHPVSGWSDTHELIDELAAYEDAQTASRRTPAVPMTYLLADPPSYDGSAAYLAAFPERAGRVRQAVLTR